MHHLWLTIGRQVEAELTCRHLGRVQLAGENEVKAQVKLRFTNSNSERMVVTRNLQVTAKKTGLSMKTLEGVLAKDENTDGNHKVGSYACSSQRSVSELTFIALDLPAEHNLDKVQRD